MTQQHEQEQRQRVLVADDDQSIRQLVSTIVRRESFAVDAAADGLEAIECLKKHEYAVVLLDLMMPRLDGFGVIEWLKKNPPLIKPIVIVITAYADQRFKEVDAEQVSGVLRKPFEVAELGNLVRACVTGFTEEVTQKLFFSKDRAIRDFVRGGDDHDT
ncbi:MAG TPA: response regulator [Thermoanaerobaculia bacterium]|jgi:CheY-like chemotaxis protein|nr:response regulator [Thermoanaerobaculia bacterium]